MESGAWGRRCHANDMRVCPDIARLVALSRCPHCPGPAVLHFARLHTEADGDAVLGSSGAEELTNPDRGGRKF